ncbi:PQ loop repeat-domain-containing protein [Phyllosticta capitalensis]|uniref:PQ loop repeat-domain-containing protein n=1 Tax=Phyllosticta capitalensis TaxID=121624 RepID=UPI0031305939
MEENPWSTHPGLPRYCAPENDFLLRLSSTFHTCVPTNLALLSTLLGTFSIISWLFAQLPQVYKNYQLKSTSGLSIFFLTEWLLGDLTNLLGCLFTDQALWQVIVASYYCFVDCCLVGQWLWYEHLQHGRPLLRPCFETQADNDSKASEPKDVRSPRYPSSPSKDAARSPHVGTPTNRTITRLGTSGSSSPASSPRTVLYISLLLAVVARASPLHSPSPVLNILETADAPAGETATQIAGRLLSWVSTLMYLGSRMPQLYKNWKRQSTEGLSPTLFLAAFMGNLFYSSSIVTNPCAWYTFPANGGRGWVGAGGSDRVDWVGRATPFFLGAAGVLIMDAAVGVQFWLYGEGTEKTVVVPDEGGAKWRWRKLSGWMRGWIPGPRDMTPPRREERQRLLDDGVGSGIAREDYGGV